MRAKSHSNCGARRSSGGGETSAHSVAKPPAGGRGGLHPFWPLLPVGVRHRGVARGSVRRIVLNGKVVSIGHHYAFPPMLTREFSVMVGLMSGKTTSQFRRTRKVTVL